MHFCCCSLFYLCVCVSVRACAFCFVGGLAFLLGVFYII